MTQTFSSLAGFAAHIAAIDRDMKNLGPALVARACQLVCDEAKRVLGSYDYAWPALKAATIAKKTLH
jgi:hypothetical protein